ncbi:hypothetical protein NOR51B_575 [Luminiphilus syltensis NOR5-1B]|uniref:Uncharacterized protein n=1 Tax=Luminiphilus syltensis NOR5-1B TaxID=565045 RepID=B8KV27_9GAMM|nr:hypothetical protein NOR51B_575 [Luminiphilus syltensis NOR5-1B]
MVGRFALFSLSSVGLAVMLWFTVGAVFASFPVASGAIARKWRLFRTFAAIDPPPNRVQ